MIQLREYQTEAVRAILEKLRAQRSTLLVMATGTGKTRTFTEVARRVVAAGRGRVLILAHREELIAQARDSLADLAGLRVGIEKAERHVAPALEHVDAVVASVMSLASEARRQAFPRDAFRLVVIDEAHHALAANTYGRALDHFASARVLGVTATPDRADGSALGSVFESVAFTYSIRDAIDDGHLVPIRQKAVQIEGLDISHVRTVAGDLADGEVEQAMLEAHALEGVVRPTVELAGDRPTVVFAAGVQHARELAAVFRTFAGRDALAMDGEMDRSARAEALAAFRSGGVQFLVNCQLLTEGFDEPSIACVAMARPTKSRALYTQCIGRGTRLHPGKADLLVLDYQGNAGRHSLVNVADVLGGNEDPDVIRRAKKLSESGEPTVHEALNEARRQVAEERRRALIEQARYQIVEVDPFNILGAEVRETWRSGMEPSAKQIEMLQRNGIEARGLNRGQASALIDRILDRQKRGLCTFKQARMLARYGIDPDVSFEEAGRHMDYLASRGWKVRRRKAL